MKQNNVAINYSMVVLQGRVSVDPSMADVGNGKKAINFNIANNVSKDRVYFIPCTLFTDSIRRIEHFNKYVKKGVYMLVEGELMTSKNKSTNVENVKVNVKGYKIGSYIADETYQPAIQKDQPQSNTTDISMDAFDPMDTDTFDVNKF